MSKRTVIAAPLDDLPVELPLDYLEVRDANYGAEHMEFMHGVLDPVFTGGLPCLAVMVSRCAPRATSNSLSAPSRGAIARR